MPDEFKTVVIDGQSTLLIPIDGSFSSVECIDGQSEVVLVQDKHDAEYYAGPYEVIPAIRDQVLETKLKLMSDDLTVKEIPYYETSNLQGITVYIADSLED